MDTPQDTYQKENNSKTLVVLFIVLILVIGLVVTLIFFLKPKTQKFDTKTNNVKNTPREHIESLEPLIDKVYNLTSELRLYDELFDELVYAESPDVNRIGDFVTSYRNFASKYARDANRLHPGQISGVYDTTLISFDRQKNFMKGSVEILLESIEKKRKVFVTIPVTYPIDKKISSIVSGFGMRFHPILKINRLHSGIDFTAPVGTPVVATANGKVIMTDEKPGYGRSCIVEHKFGYQTLYGHLVRLVVGESNEVAKGDIIGYVGNTGLSEAPHLHYEVRKNGNPLNPSFMIFEGLSREEYKEVIAQGSKATEVLSF